MRKMLVLSLLVPGLLSAEVEEDEDDWYDASYCETLDDFAHAYVDVGGALVLPQGGASLNRRGGACARAGYYVGDFLAVEGSVSWLEDTVGLGVQGLWHWWGYEKFDPFFTFGANGWIDGGVGPSLGWGCFWHFDDTWSLRADAAATLDLDGDAEMVYSLGIGLQFAF